MVGILDLPAELLDDICRDEDDNFNLRDLSALPRVNRRFHAVFTGPMYREVMFTPPPLGSICIDADRFFLFAVTVCSKPELAAMVQSFVLRTLPASHERWRDALRVEGVELGLLENIRRVAGPDFYLKSYLMSGIICGRSTGSLVLLTLALLPNLRALSIFHLRESGPNGPSGLHALFFENLTRLVAPADGAVAEDPATRCLQRLLYLEVGGSAFCSREDLSPLAASLMQLPSLKYLNFQRTCAFPTDMSLNSATTVRSATRPSITSLVLSDDLYRPEERSLDLTAPLPVPEHSTYISRRLEVISGPITANLQKALAPFNGSLRSLTIDSRVALSHMMTHAPLDLGDFTSLERLDVTLPFLLGPQYAMEHWAMPSVPDVPAATERLFRLLSPGLKVLRVGHCGGYRDALCLGKALAAFLRPRGNGARSRVPDLRVIQLDLVDLSWYQRFDARRTFWHHTRDVPTEILQPYVEDRIQAEMTKVPGVIRRHTFRALIAVFLSGLKDGLRVAKKQGIQVTLLTSTQLGLEEALRLFDDVQQQILSPWRLPDLIKALEDEKRSIAD